MEIKVNNVSITLTPEQMAQICKESKPEFTYPLFKKWKDDGVIVKFTALNDGEVVWSGTSERISDKIGNRLSSLNRHTDSRWEDVPYDAERDLWHGQPVYCWNNESPYGRAIRFYDAINNCGFSIIDGLEGYNWKYYEAINPTHYTSWMIEAFNTLPKD